MNTSAHTVRKQNGNDSARPEESGVPEANLQVFNSSEVAQYYAALDYLTPCEKLLFDKYLRPGMAILDLGVGGGRTTPYLSSIASRYVGVDYASQMIANCRKRFPRLEFQVANAADLTAFASASFDAAVMAFNGIDSVIPDEARFSALKEIGRVLKPEGVLIFSSHNPRAVFVRPAWNSKKVEQIARMLVDRRRWLLEPARLVLLCLRVSAALFRSAMVSSFRFSHRVWHRAFWSGVGYMMDSSHGGLLTHYGMPKRIIAEVEQQGFDFVQLAGDDYPHRSRIYVTDWYYYVFQKPNSPADLRCE
jgi:SAM-dependent methyltransferase